MEVHIIYLPLVFFLGMTYEYWRRRRLNRRRVATIVHELRKSVKTREALMQAGEQDPPTAHY